MMTPRDNPLLTYLVDHLLIDHGVQRGRLNGKSLQYIEGYHDSRHLVGELHDHAGYELAKEAKLAWLMEQIDIPIRQERDRGTLVVPDDLYDTFVAGYKGDGRVVRHSDHAKEAG